MTTPWHEQESGMTGLASDSKHEQSINDGMFPDAGRGPGRKHGVNDFVLMDPSRADVVQVALALGVQGMARHHAIVKKLGPVETLG